MGELSAIVEWWDANARELPWRATRDPYAVWVSEVMSAQTSVERAAQAWEHWMRRWPTVESLAASELREVLAQWQGLGYPRRARDLHRSARLIVERGWPDELTELPGVGPYIADAVRCFALEQPVLPVDVNVERVLRRRFAGGVDVSADPWRSGQALMEFGQRICSARPRCDDCPVSAGCRGPEGPATRSTAVRRQARFDGSVRQRRGRLLALVLSEGSVPVETADAEAATGLVQDGLLSLVDGHLTPPS